MLYNRFQIRRDSLHEVLGCFQFCAAVYMQSLEDRAVRMVALAIDLDDEVNLQPELVSWRRVYGAPEDIHQRHLSTSVGTTITKAGIEYIVRPAQRKGLPQPGAARRLPAPHHGTTGPVSADRVIKDARFDSPVLEMVGELTPTRATTLASQCRPEDMPPMKDLIRPIAVLLNALLLLIALWSLASGRMGNDADEGDMMLAVVFVAAPAMALAEMLRRK